MFLLFKIGIYRNIEAVQSGKCFGGLLEKANQIFSVLKKEFILMYRGKIYYYKDFVKILTFLKGIEF